VKDGVSHLSRSFRHEVGHSFYNLYEVDKNIIWKSTKKVYIKKNDEEYFAEAFAFFHSEKYDGRFEKKLEDLFITLLKPIIKNEANNFQFFVNFHFHRYVSFFRKHKRRRRKFKS